LNQEDISKHIIFIITAILNVKHIRYVMSRIHLRERTSLEITTASEAKCFHVLYYFASAKLSYYVLMDSITMGCGAETFQKLY